MRTVFFRVLEAEDKGAALLSAVRAQGHAYGHQRFEIDPTTFAAVPGSPFSYWVSERLRSLFKKLPPFESEGRTAKCGAGTLDDYRFLRLDWEPDRRSGEWVPLAKGGAFGRFYSDIYFRVGWASEGAEVKSFVEAKVGSASRKIQAQSWYFRPGLTWPGRTQSFGVRALPAGCIFGAKGPAAFIDGDREESLLAHLALLASKAVGALVAVSLNAADATARSYEVGIIQRTPIPRLNDASRSALAGLGRRAWSLRRCLDTRSETSHAFILPALLQVSGNTLSERTAAWDAHCQAVEAELGTIQAEIDECCLALYGIDDADLFALTDDSALSGPGGSASALSGGAEPDDSEKAEDGNEPASDATGLAAELVSWAVGVAFARFDVRLANGALSPLPEPGPFDPLPLCSPGMLTGRGGLPLAHPPAGYPLGLPEAGVFVDDPGHAHDLSTAARAVLEVAFGSEATRWCNEITALLDPKGQDLRSWLSGGFFERHLRNYSRSRRKAPIYWQLATPSASYSVWLYVHALTKDTLFRVQNDYVTPKLAHEERRLEALRSELRDGGRAAQRKELSAQEMYVEELRAILEEIKQVAPLWNPNLDDGVIINCAPLWRVVSRHKAWQKELKATWDALCDGKYDWAHLAMHLWPERVVPKCATDRSFAIAHGLEEVFWVEGSDSKWTARKTPTRPIEELVRERTSAAVKSALKSLLEAPPLTGSNGARMGVRRRATVAPGEEA